MTEDRLGAPTAPQPEPTSAPDDPGGLPGLLDAAMDLHRAGRLDEAVALYARVLAVRPDHADALHLSGIADYQAGRTARAVAFFRSALAVHPAFASAHNSLGNLLADRRDYDAAARLYGRAIILEDYYADAWANLGTVHQARLRVDEAIAAYDRALRFDPHRVGTRYNLGVMHHAKGTLPQAAHCFHEVVKADPGHADGWRSLAMVLRALNHPDAEVCLRRALADSPGDVELSLELGSLLNETGRPAEAEPILRPALAVRPDHPGLRFVFGSVLAAQGCNAEAVDSFRVALAGNPRLTGVWNNLGVALLDLGDTREAVDALRIALAINPADSTALNNLGNGLEELERVGEAETAYRRALALRPQYVKALNNLGAICNATLRHAEAARLQRTAIVLQPDYGEPYTNLGAVLQAVDRWSDALGAHRRALHLTPRHPMALTNLGLALQVLGRLDEAEAAHRAAIAIDGRHAESLGNLGMLYWQGNRPDEAEGFLARALEIKPSLATVRLNLGLVHLALGKITPGWVGYGWRFRAKGYRDRAITAPLWDGQPLANGTLLVWREQGVGDEILFSSCYRMLDGVAKRLVIECDRRLVTLFARSFPYARVRAESVSADGVESIHPSDCHAHIAAGSLPRLFRASHAAFPATPAWLVPDPALVDVWRARVAALGPGLRVGLAWRSQMMTTERKAAYITLEALAPLLALPGVVFVNLQYGDCEAEIAAAEARLGVRIHRWTDLNLKDDFEGASALTTALDLVISPAVSTGELAGALGVPVWRIGHRDWTQLGTGVRPWYPTHRLFQPRPGEGLEQVVVRMAGNLRALMPNGAPRDADKDPAEAPDEDDPAEDTDGVLEQAAGLHRTGRLDEAAPLYERVLRRRPDDPVALHLSGLLAHQSGRSEAGAERIRRALARLPGYAGARTSLGTVLLALGRAPEAVRSFRGALALQPAAAAVLTNLGNALDAAHDLPAAAEAHRRAVAADPALAEARDNWGAALTRLNRAGEALDLHRAALRLSPEREGAWLNLAIALRRLGQEDAARRALARTLALDPALPDGLANLARLSRGMGLIDDAWRWSGRALAVEPGHPTASFTAGLLRLACGRLVEGWAGYDRRFLAHELAGAARVVPAPAWNGEDLAGRRLLVWREQGVGDEILFASCLPDVIARAGAVIVECDHRLVPLFARSFPAAIIRPSPLDPEAPCEAVDRHAAMGSLPRWLRPSLTDYPPPGHSVRPGFLTVDQAEAAEWRRRLDALGPGLKVGVAWRSGLLTAERVASYSRIDDWAPVFAVPGVTFVNLQYGDCTAEREEARRRFGVTLHVWPDLNLKDDFDRVAALMTGLDLVITPASSVGELAGAVGTPVWRFGIPGDWTALGTGVRPWFPSMRLFSAPQGQPVSAALPLIARALTRLGGERPAA